MDFMKSLLNSALAAMPLGLFFMAGVALAEPDTTSSGKKLDFDDEVVEGVNKSPLDSLSQIAEAEKQRRKLHLYRKKSSFVRETVELLRELRFFE